MMMLALATLPALAQDKSPLGALDIHTSAVCDMCKTTIDGGLIYEKGVKSADLDLKTNVIHVTYNASKTDPQKIRTAVTKLGYAADDMPADPKAFKNLEACCKKGGCEKPGVKH